MRTYVTSLRARARLAHIGNSYWTACGFIIADQFAVTREMPENRVVCARCIKKYAPSGNTGPSQAVLRAREQRRTAAAAAQAEKEEAILADLRRGRHTKEILRERGLALRTYVRYTTRLRRRFGARTMFQFGYLVGLAERDYYR